MRKAALKPAEPDHGEKALRGGAHVGFADTLLAQPVLHVLLDVEPGEQRVVLEHDAAIRPRALDRHPVEQHRAGVGLLEAGENIEQGRFPAAARAEQGQKLARLDVEVDYGALDASLVARAAGLGQTIRLRHATNGELVGSFKTIDETGRLMLLLPGGRTQAIAAGDVLEVVAPEAARSR